MKKIHAENEKTRDKQPALHRGLVLYFINGK
jgi:hypothetical protein